MNTRNGALRVASLLIVPDQWYAVEESRSVRVGPVHVARLGEDLVLWRTSTGDVHCMIDRCPHRGVALSLGNVVGDELECGYHGFRFRSDGTCTGAPCEGQGASLPPALHAQTLPAREAHGLIWVWWGSTERYAETPLPWPDSMPAQYEKMSSSDGAVWPVPHFRAVESVFDFHHAPVLHGRGPLARQRRMDGLIVENIGNTIELTGTMREELADATLASKGLSIRSTFRMPGVVHMRIGRFINLLSVDTPIDAATTWRYSRYLSPFENPLGCGRAIASVIRRFDMRLTQRNEDLPMVTTQAHFEKGFFADVFVPADEGIRTYIRLRNALLRAARREPNMYPRWVRSGLGPDQTVQTSAMRAHAVNDVMQ
jgi:phenylpropionate dioxygenase-like ring-hydroxylating dioxygenase large terminal subunit